MDNTEPSNKEDNFITKSSEKIRNVKKNIQMYFIRKMIYNAFGKETFLSSIEKQLHKAIVEDNDSMPKAILEKKYNFVMAIFAAAQRNIIKGWISKSVAKKLTDSLINEDAARVIQNILSGNPISQDQQASLENGELSKIRNEFKKKYNIPPPFFIVFAPTQVCNLQCCGCYASSKINAPSLSFETVDKICDEVYNEWGNRFMTITGGEPLMYKDNGKTLFDIWKKYPRMFFMFYTNGTLINEENAMKLAEVGNVSPAISVEGWEKETDERRGKGVFKRIIEATDNLKKAGVPFGVSITATSKNIDILLDDKFYDYMFQEVGAVYMWMFQLMPIGKAVDTTLMITPEQRVKLFRKWEELLTKKRYCIADFWNSGVLADGCIAYGREGGYLYVDWNGNITPCVFVPYYVDNVLDLYKQGKKLADALNSDFFKNGRKWQEEYGLSHRHDPDNWLMPCSIRDHYKNFKHNILTKEVKPEDAPAAEALKSKAYEKTLEEFDKELEEKTSPIWKKEYLNQP